MDTPPIPPSVECPSSADGHSTLGGIGGVHWSILNVSTDTQHHSEITRRTLDFTGRTLNVH